MTNRRAGAVGSGRAARRERADAGDGRASPVEDGRMSQTKSPLPREVADAYVEDLIALDPITGTYLGVPDSSSRLPDTSPAGQEALAELARTTLAKLAEAERRPAATVTPSGGARGCCGSG
ncbi:hypothetical protein GCM10020256_67070 [Streptomyces thermocoprophilus]